MFVLQNWYKLPPPRHNSSHNQIRVKKAALETSFDQIVNNNLMIQIFGAFSRFVSKHHAWRVWSHNLFFKWSTWDFNKLQLNEIDETIFFSPKKMFCDWFWFVKSFHIWKSYKKPMASVATLLLHGLWSRHVWKRRVNFFHGIFLKKWDFLGILS